MSILERVRELGMMRAMGMRDRQIAGCSLWKPEGSVFSVLWEASSWISCEYLSGPEGNRLLRLMEQGDMGYRFAGIAYGIWNPATFVTAFAVGLVMALTVAWLPTRRALKLEITDCLRFI